MTRIEDALAWSGSDVVVSMFAVSTSEKPLPVEMAYGTWRPQRVRVYALDDVLDVLGDRRLFEYDASFSELPTELDAYVESCLRDAMSHGAVTAWCAFEGSFDFEYLLSPEIAAQVYGLADHTGVSVACDRDLATEEWKSRVLAARRRLLRL